MGTFTGKNLRILRLRVAPNEACAVRKNPHGTVNIAARSASAERSTKITASIVLDGNWISRLLEPRQAIALETLAGSSSNPNTPAPIFSSMFSFREACIKPPQSLYAPRLASVTFAPIAVIRQVFPVYFISHVE